jgi:hypothetical protein
MAIENTGKFIKLIKDTKKPICAWKNDKSKQHNFKDIDPKYYNIGLLTGKISNVIVVDVDFYKMEDDNIFLVEFKDFLKIKTLIIKTPSGGYHLYFNYDEDLYNVASNIQVDIRSDNGYIVFPPSEIEGNKYEIISDKDIIDVSENLKEFLLKYVCKRSNVSTTEKTYDKKQTPIEKQHETYLDNLDDEDIKKLQNKIIKCLEKEKSNKKFFESYDEFLYFTTSMKKLKLKSTWDDFNKSQEGYNQLQNNKIWESCNIDYDMTKWLLKKLKFGVYDLYKPILKNKIKPHKVIDKSKLGDIIKENHNYIVRSDTGTGKTTTFKEYIKKNNFKFISITSRVSLAEEQYQQFNKHKIICSLYTIEEIQDNYSCIIQIDSISKLYNIKNYSNYVLFLDEFNSIISYLLQSSTLKNYRVNVMKILIELIKNCKQFICVDADISDLSVKFIDFCKRDYKFIDNDFLHNKGVEAEEIFEYERLILKLEKEDKFLLCTDSKSQAEIICKKLDDPEIKLITSETDEYINFDEHNKIVYSPKIIYGIDSTKERPVYCLYTERTINPKNMLQQIARCRNIEKLYFCFLNKSYKEDKTTFEENKDRLKRQNDYSLKEFKLLASKDIYDLYFDLICDYDYNELCYKTNKFGHFLNLIIQRGFKYNYVKKETKYDVLEQKKDKKELREEKLENFDININRYKKINEILKVPIDEVDDYKEYFIDSYLLLNHFYITKFVKYTDRAIKDELNNKDEFNINKINSVDNKIKFLKLLKRLTYNNDIYTIDSQPPMMKDLQYLNEEYKIICDRKNNIDFNIPYECNKIQYKLYTDIFEDIGFLNVADNKKVKVNKKVITKYTVNKDYFEKDLNLLKFRFNELDDKILNKKRII